jgi:predicted ArsR family transcriptional regulator
MNLRTRKLLGLLAEDLTDAVLLRCRDCEASELELREASGASHATLASRLDLLEAHGLVRRRVGDSAGGRRPSLWDVANDDVVQRFIGAADAFALELLQAMRADVEQTMRERPEREEAEPPPD